MRVGCQTFTWEMLGSGWTGSTDDILDAIAGAGYAGLEITNKMIGPYAFDAPKFKAALEQRNLSFVAFGWSAESGFTDRGAFAADLEDARRTLAFLAEFPGTVLSIGSATAHREGAADEMIDIAADFYNQAGALGREMGVPVAFHPSSHHMTALLTRPHYERIMARTDPALIGWVPDTGHIVRGQMDLLATLKDFKDRIRYVHLKDATRAGEWAMMGEGDCDMPAVIACLKNEIGFDGWLILEEESPEAGKDPGRAVATNRAYMSRVMG